MVAMKSTDKEYPLKIIHCTDKRDVRWITHTSTKPYERINESVVHRQNISTWTNCMYGSITN